MSVIAVIPARGGSKRIPRKNIRDFAGRPMISHPIRTLQKCGLFDKIIVSTDDEEIAEVSRQEGAEVPFVRPPELSDDHTGTDAVVVHAINLLNTQGDAPDYVCCVYPTSPFLEEKYLRRGWEAIQSGWKRAFSVTSFAYPIQRAVKLLDKGGVEPFFPEYIPYRSQDLQPAFHDAGQFYWGASNAWLEGVSIFSEEASPIVLPRYLVQDIDDEEDWIRAELMFKALGKK